MADNEIKKGKGGPSRYPLGDTMQAKRTLARLIRDCLNGRIDIDRYRAGVYGINTLIQIFKIENPVMNVQDVTISFMKPEEREARIRDILNKYHAGDEKQESPPEIAGMPCDAVQEIQPPENVAVAVPADRHRCGIGARR